MGLVPQLICPRYRKGFLPVTSDAQSGSGWKPGWSGENVIDRVRWWFGGQNDPVFLSDHDLAKPAKTLCLVLLQAKLAWTV